ncbi:hypothetical protein [Allosalinactinospora lopnorensis]|uniref:hypothetical protein n=1 Tax=Allosalinactinospora lopnorensis TaxID=1352348 RepID=UPI00191C4910|nr:hypothetical protein [Allosalinactinospora lopnorensis]
MNDADEQPHSGKQPTVYWWDTYQASHGVWDGGPCGACRSEATARACIEAALGAVANSEVYAWGQLSRVSLSFEGSSHWGARTPVAWAEYRANGMIAWRPGLASPSQGLLRLNPPTEPEAWCLEPLSGEPGAAGAPAGRTRL